MSLFLTCLLVLGVNLTASVVGAPTGQAVARPDGPVDRYLAGYEAMDVEAMLSAYAPDAVFEDVAQRHRVEGTKELRQLLDQLVALHTAMGIDERRRLTDGETVVVEYVFTGTLSAEALRAATGKESCVSVSYELPATSWFRRPSPRASSQRS